MQTQQQSPPQKGMVLLVALFLCAAAAGLWSALVCFLDLANGTTRWEWIAAVTVSWAAALGLGTLIDRFEEVEQVKCDLEPIKIRSTPRTSDPPHL